jgi:cytochrome P450
MLTRYEDIRRAATNHELFTTSHGVTIPAMKKSAPAIPLEVDPPEHTRYFRAGDRVCLLWGSANHDEGQFPDPESFRLDRQRNHHLTFGAGAHKCLGEHLARLEITVVVSEVLRRIPDYELVDPDRVEWTPGMNREMKSLPVTFSPWQGARLDDNDEPLMSS